MLLKEAGASPICSYRIRRGSGDNDWSSFIGALLGLSIRLSESSQCVAASASGEAVSTAEAGRSAPACTEIGIDQCEGGCCAP
jgi:hypothetical protein